MPDAALRPCPGNHGRCPHLAGRCPDHTPTHQSWATPAPPPRIRGRALQRIRKGILTTEPWCRLCAQQGKRRLATIVDHIVNLKAGGQDVPSNRQPLCADCHTAKTQQEAARGRR
jgi:5-methylcytosine-specific restriction protein A